MQTMNTNVPILKVFLCTFGEGDEEALFTKTARQ